ncbi:adenylate/guanylate cyclase domain-containing protein [Rhizobium bangladeshense]|uniref:adenylate/guanylate cyclase domain-containing protein n=1 Tax=Rhizobium bangladeshense TaxID=1138189 RepID=UPI001C834F7D|nr:adenylate/guanylate cyclase domain-containing protein [Rhizobium bangladeshense]MBX4901041.1 adenylate/guanylate cyclase domain-containing protein [Rhizobium bangladeshense]MBX4920611.1 adenylate/guanylate cyclase domain-containing protein [Rhizobium bangladeshense]
MDRKLVAILAADVVGYSALMERDETGTFERLATIRKKLIEPEIARRRGCIFKLMGDGLLAEFGSAVDAVECAVSVQRALNERNAEVPQNERLELRIGLNLGEVIVDGDDRYGEGVNVSARLQQLADPGGICISGKVVREVEKTLAFGFEPMGEQRVKNIAGPITVHRLVQEGTSPEARLARPPALPNKPSIAVLAFENMSGDPEQEYFTDGLVEDVITNLSKISSLFVIARNSTFAYKSRAMDVRQIARDLGVRYVLVGSVRRAANRLRITAHLIEGRDATHIWADRFEGAAEDVFDLQDQLTERIVGTLEPTIRRAEIERARRKRPDSLDAYDLFLRALPHSYANTPADTSEALRLLGEALRLDPNYACAHGYAAWGYEQRFLRGGFHPEDRAAALRHADAALATGGDEPQALCLGGFVHATITHDYDRSINALDRALMLDGNSSLAYGLSAMVHMFNETYDQSRDHAFRALRLSPLDPMNYHSYLALAWVSLFTAQFEDAVKYSALGIQVNPAFSVLHASLAASYANLDRLEAAWAAARRLLEVAPGWTIGAFVRMDVVRPQLMDGLASALRKAGLPE